MRLIILLSFLFLSINANDVDEIIASSLYRPVLFAPWRDNYSAQSSKNELPSALATEANCPFCLEIKALDDEKYLILKRGVHCMAMLNPFPYAKGHMLIVPYEHKSDLDDYSTEVRIELIEMANISFSILKNKYQFPGANLGFNIGRCAGASIPEHLHLQLIPRRYHEISFLHLTANSSLGFDLSKMYQELKELFDKYFESER